MDSEKKHITDLSHKNQEIISFFDKDASFVFVYKKTEKLASAIYMITNLFPESEPMKWTLRKKVSEFLSFILTYKDVREAELPDFVYNVKTNVLELVSMLEISMRGGLVSSMNFSMIRAEFSNLVDTFNSTLSTPKNNQNEDVPTDFFHVSDDQYKPREHFQNRIISSQEVGNLGGKMSYNIKDNPTLVAKDEFKRSNRQNIILNLIKKKREITIKDVALVIKDCSEKTIQRELISFIKAGVLKRTGERRWSKYSLA